LGSSQDTVAVKKFKHYRETITWQANKVPRKDGTFWLSLGPDAPDADNLEVVALVKMVDGREYRVSARVLQTEWRSSDILGKHSSGKGKMLELPDTVWGSITEVELLPLPS
jgi:hypothetical protein